MTAHVEFASRMLGWPYRMFPAPFERPKGTARASFFASASAAEHEGNTGSPPCCVAGRE